MSPTIKNHCPLPLSFHPNRGQNTPDVKFQTQASGYDLLLTPTAAVMVLKPSTSLPRALQTNDLSVGKSFPLVPEESLPATRVQLKMSGANEDPQILGLDQLPGEVNYFLGNSPSNWLTNIPTYARVQYRDIYPGIDIIYSICDRQLEWDFIVRPGASPDLITLDFTENDEVILDQRGNLLLTVGKEQIRISKPIIYQETALQRNSVFGSYRLNGQQVSLELSDYDPTKPLIIDPIIEYSTYLGGLYEDKGYGVTTDLAGNTYITGLTWSSWTSPPGFPIKAPYQADNAGMYNAFITKIASNGTLVYSTYLGGTSADTSHSIAVDTQENTYVIGTTYSNDFPMVNPIQANNNGGWEVFVTKLNATGNALIYSTYLGGTQDDMGSGITVDSSGAAYVTGYTQSSSLFPPGFPTKNAIQPDNNSIFPLYDVFVTKINHDGSLGYSTYLGGANNDMGASIAVDAKGNAYVTGSTTSMAPNGFPITPGCFQANLSGNTDAFITKLNFDGSLAYSTYLGGSSYDEASSIAIDSIGNGYVTGFTVSLDFPTKLPFQPNNNGVLDAFVTKINVDGSALIYSTYLGGNSDDRGYGIAVDTNQYAYVTGTTYSSGDSSPPGFPTKRPIQPGSNSIYPFSDAFIAKLAVNGSSLIYSTYLGGKAYDEGISIAADKKGNTYVTGFTLSSWNGTPPGPPGFPIKNPIQDDNNGPWDAFSLKLTAVANLTIMKSASPSPLPLGQNLTYQITVTNLGPDPATNVLLTDTLPPDVTFISASTGCQQLSGTITCNLGILDPDTSTSITIIVTPQKIGSITNTATVTSSQSAPTTTTIITKVIPPPIPLFYTNRTIVRDWQKYPPFFTP